MSLRDALAAPRSRIPAINGMLFASLFFFLPAHVAPAYSISGLILLLSLVEGRFAEKWAQLKGDPLFWIFQAFFWITPLSLLWTDDLQAGLRMVGRYAFFLLSPLYLTIARRELAPRCIAAFLADLMEAHFALGADPAIAPLRNIQNAADAYPRKRLIDYLSSRAPQL